MRGVLLAAGFVLGSATLSAQGVTSLEGQVYTPAQLVDGGKYVIKNVGSNESRQGWMFEQDGRLHIDVANKDNAATSLTADVYVFTAHAVEGQTGTYQFEAESGNYIHYVANMQALTTTDAATNITLVPKTNNLLNGAFNLQVPGPSYLNVNNWNGEDFVSCVGYNDANDVNGRWEIYAVNGTAQPTELLPFATSTVSGDEWTGDEKWYTLFTRGAYWTYNSETHKINLQATTASIADNYLWCFAGDETNGYKIYNRAAGPSRALTVTDNNAVDMLEGEGTALAVAFTPGTDDTYRGGWAMRVMGDGTYYLNRQDKSDGNGHSLWIWNNDAAKNELGSVIAFNGPLQLAPGYAVDLNNGTFTRHNPSGTYHSRWESNATEPQLVLTGTANNMETNGTNINLFNDTYTLTVPRGWHIVGYSFNFTNKDTGTNMTVTPAGGTAVTCEGEGSARVEVNDIDAQMVSLTVSHNASGAHAAQTSDFVVRIALDETSLLDATKVYRFCNGRAQEYITSAGVTKAGDAYTGNVETGENSENFSMLWTLEEDTWGYKIKSLNGGVYFVSASRSTSVGDANAATVYAVEAGNSEANCVFHVLESNQYINAFHSSENDGHAIGTYKGGANDAGNLWEISEVTELPLTVSAAGYATVNYPVAVQLPEGVTAYSVSEENDTEIVLSQLTLTDGVLPAGTPVLVAAAQGTYPLTLMPANDEAALETGFNGTTLSEVIADDVNAYILAKHEGDDAAKFYELATNEGDATTNRTLGTNKAYYVANGAAAASFTLRFGGTTTGIDSVTAAEGADTDVYYDLSGRRVLYPTKGIYVKADGTKVFLK